MGTATLNGKLRASARDRASAMSWPDASIEEWRRTDLSRQPMEGFSPEAAHSAERDEVEIGSCDGPAALIRFEGGRCAQAELCSDSAQQGVELEILYGDDFEQYAEYLQAGIDAADNKVRLSHYGELSHGFFLKIPDGMILDKPIEIDFSESGDMTNPHGIVVVGEGAEVVILQRVASSQAGVKMVNLGLDVHQGANSGVQYVLYQSVDHEAMFFSYANVFVERDARFRMLDAALGGKLVKTRVECIINGSGADVELEGVYYAKADQHLDVSTLQSHRAPNAYSRALYKGALEKGGRTVYRGMIHVDQQAVQTDAYLTNKNLLIEKGARADSMPMLNIETNDVKCSHGSTTGRIDDEELFYLQARGFTKEQAKEMLILGFFDAIILDAPERIREYLRERVHRLVVD